MVYTKQLILLVSLLKMIQVINCNKDAAINKTMNSTNPKDMYVINAMVYQVGILTNKSDDKHLNATVGNQEALTLYRTNGSKFDLSSIPAPLFTNVTAQSMVQVAPKLQNAGKNEGTPQVSWNELKQLASLQQGVPNIKPVQPENPKIVRRSVSGANTNELPQMDVGEDLPGHLRYLFKRESTDHKTTVKVVKGSAVVPQSAVVQSIAIPPLLTLNYNLSQIPVPIPNTSVVHYAKINTVVRKP